MLDWTACTAVERSPEKVSGAWLFRGTRVPVKTLFENLEDEATVDQFLEWFPGVSLIPACVFSLIKGRRCHCARIWQGTMS
jgi:uncharacterized protein (DUF433 family)